MMTFVKLAAAVALSAAMLGAHAADLQAGQKIADAQCAACHGKDFKSPIDPSYPKLAGQYADYLVQTLIAYQRGDRKNPIMAGLAKPLSRQDIINLAAYFESLPGPLSHRR
jgi:cytochrome c553